MFQEGSSAAKEASVADVWSMPLQPASNSQYARIDNSIQGISAVSETNTLRVLKNLQEER